MKIDLALFLIHAYETKTLLYNISIIPKIPQKKQGDEYDQLQTR